MAGLICADAMLEEGSNRISARNRVETTPGEGMTTQDPPQGEYGPVKQSMAAHGKHRVFRARGLEAAGAGNPAHRMQERGKPPPVELKHGRHRPFFRSSGSLRIFLTLPPATGRTPPLGRFAWDGG